MNEEAVERLLFSGCDSIITQKREEIGVEIGSF